MMLTLQDPEDIREDRRHCDPASEQILNFAEFVYRLVSESADSLLFLKARKNMYFSNLEKTRRIVKKCQ